MDQGETMTIGQLAERSGMTVRNLRAYLQLGLLEASGKDGRSLTFSSAHIEQLERIESLRERGHSLAGIVDILSVDGAALLADDVEAIGTLTSRWVHGRTAAWTRAEFVELFPGLTEVDLVWRQVIERGLAIETADGTLETDRPELFRAAADLYAKGMPVELLLDEPERLRELLEPLIDHIMATQSRILGPNGTPGSESLAHLWPSTLLVLASDMTRAIAGRVSASDASLQTI